jgi:hypothetical protein
MGRPAGAVHPVTCEVMPVYSPGCRGAGCEAARTGSSSKAQRGRKRATPTMSLPMPPSFFWLKVTALVEHAETGHLGSLWRFSIKKRARVLPCGEHPDAPCAILILLPGYREYTWSAACFLGCRKRMRVLSHVRGLVRVSLPKRTHQPIIFTLLKSSSSHYPSKGIRSLLQSGNCLRALSASASTVRLGQNRLRGVVESRTVRGSGRHYVACELPCQEK